MYHSRYAPYYTAYYTQIPYLDNEIHTVQNMRLNQAALRTDRVARTIQGLAATARKADILDHQINRSRRDDYLQDRELHQGLAFQTRNAIDRGNAEWNNFSARRNLERAQDYSNLNHLSSRLQDNRNRSLERLGQVRRWI